MLNKQEPAALVAGVASISAPLWGEYAWIFVGALVGGFLGVSAMETGHLRAVLLMTRSVLISVVFTSIIATGLGAWFGYPAEKFLVPVAVLLAWIGDDWRRYLDRVVDVGLGFLGRFK